MWLFTTSVVKDYEVIYKFLGLTRESWAVLAQWASALAVVYAARVAAQYQEKKDTLARKQMMRQHLAAFKLFKNLVEGYFYIAFDGESIPKYYDPISLINEIHEDFTRFKLRKEEIASTLPSDAIQPFNQFLKSYETLDRLSLENNKDNDDDMHEVWRSTIKRLDLVIQKLEVELEGSRNKTKSKTKQKTKNKSEN